MDFAVSGQPNWGWVAGSEGTSCDKDIKKKNSDPLFLCFILLPLMSAFKVCTDYLGQL